MMMLFYRTWTGNLCHELQVRRVPINLCEPALFRVAYDAHNPRSVEQAQAACRAWIEANGGKRWISG